MRTPSGSHPGAFCFQRSPSLREYQHTRGSAGFQQACRGPQRPQELPP
jgi:hypothetical protein